MRRKKLGKKLMAGFAMAATICSAMPTMKVAAAMNTVEARYIQGDGVRLRKQGGLKGEILELMYDGERINFYPELYGADSEYNYMQRVKTGTYGYVDHHYTRFTR